MAAASWLASGAGGGAAAAAPEGFTPAASDSKLHASPLCVALIGKGAQVTVSRRLEGCQTASYA